MVSPKKRLWIISRNGFPFTSRLPKRPVPGSNNPIRSQDSSLNTGSFHRVLAGVLTKWMFVVRGSRRMISFGFKVTFCIEKQFQGDLSWSDCSTDKCSIWTRMKWTWHHSKFAIDEVSFYHRLKVVLPQLLFIYDGAVGMRDYDVMLLWP